MLYQDGEFFFLEMNTRLQVEHCVTEEITGLDLVAEQLHVAAGEPLRFTQDSIERRGHSIECRINAEDPAKKFLPSPGTIARLRVPSGPGVRWDGGYDEGDTISQYYDNLDRQARSCGRRIATRAIDRMLRALVGVRDRGREDDDPRALALLADRRLPRRHALDEVGRGRGRPGDVRGRRGRDRSRVPAPADERARSSNGRCPSRSTAAASACASGCPTRRRRGVDRGRSRARWPTQAHAAAGAGGGAGSGTVTAPMQGTIVKVLVEVGAAVEAGDALLVLEAMKMENQINAEASGTVEEIRVAAGDAVGTGDVLAIIE